MEKVEERNPNSFKYFDPDYGMTYNNECPNCGDATWCQESAHTCYEGKRYSKNKLNENGTYDIVGVLHWDSKDKGKCGVWCEPCYLKKGKI